MPRDFEVYIEDILQAIAKIRDYVEGLTRQSFAQDNLRIDAVVRNLEIIGEAAKMVPDAIRVEYPNIEWKKISGLRDILAHHYFEVDLDIVWDVVQNKLPSLEKELSKRPR